jgi:hypothetical protein
MCFRNPLVNKRTHLYLSKPAVKIFAAFGGQTVQHQQGVGKLIARIAAGIATTLSIL